MKKIALFLLLNIFTVILFAQEEGFLSNIYRYLEDPSLFELNQEEGHAVIVPYKTPEEALIDNRANSAGYLSLNGNWRFHYSDTPEGVPGDSRNAYL